MKIEVIAKLFVGYRFSDLCVVDKEKQIVSFCTLGLEEKALKGFDDEILDINEVTPEFISLIMDLDFIENSDGTDGIIGRLVFPISEIGVVVSRDWFISVEKILELLQ